MPRKPPPAEHRFKKGQSGNAGGRSTEQKLFILRARAFMSEKGFAALTKEVERGGADRIRALQLLTVYGIGKPLEAGQVAALEQALASKVEGDFQAGRLNKDELRQFRALLRKGYTAQPGEHWHRAAGQGLSACTEARCSLERVGAPAQPQLPAGDVVDAELKR